ncbi:family 78 glycoside hydrolase catalytic domain [Leifsonia shinshuensis]|uniref:alpha-L-rhamnosidase n=1 Tax=Leifsonia shinshuensis TaxID=150026 RepID=A0A853D056_9MICO|nr:alpha-L-rhamnosidase [Leifsonia shinshuensis]
MTERRCRDLRVEYLREPAGVATARPRFSWVAEHEQRAYRLVVAEAGGQVVWDTGIIDSAETTQVAYAGEALASDAVYTWSVRSLGADGTEVRAESHFETAVLDPATWKARWVEPAQQPTALERWTLLDWIRGVQPEGGPAERLRPVQLLRQRFVVGDDIVRARLHATARGVYLPHLNGTVVGDEVLSPGFDSYTHRISVQAYDVTQLVRPGENVLAVAVADGWWAGRIGITGSSAQWGDTTSALWQLHLDHADGARTVIASGGDVVSATGPWVYADLFVGERYDRRLLQPGWTSVDFDDSEWTPVDVTDGVSAALVPFAGEPVRRVQELPAVSVTAVPGADGGWIVDFGQVIAGRVRLTLRGLDAGDEVVVEHTEALAADGSWFVNIVGINTEQTDVYVAAGPEEDTWEPSFTFHGFRYARLTGLPQAPALADVVAVVLASDLEPTGSFTTSDARLNRLHENVVWSQRGNFLSIPTDCPQRERAGWTGDIQVFAPAATNNAMVAPFLSRWLQNLRADQLADGRVPIVSPRSPFDEEAAASGQGIGGIVAAAGWGDAIAIVPWTLYQRYGDVRVLEESFPAVLRWIDHQATPAYAEGAHFGDWLAPSTLEGKPFHEAIGVAPALTGALIAPMFRARTLTIASEIADVLGRPGEAAELAGRSAQVRAEFAEAHVAADGGLPVELQGVYTLALAFGMVPEDRIPAAAARLAALVTDRGDRLDTGFLSVPYLLDVLWDHGYPELARRVLWQPAQPSWLYEVDHGATTIWENWDAVAPDGTTRQTSLNHYAFGCVDDWLYRRVAGLRATAPGYRSAVIEPDLEAGVDQVEAHVTTPYGRLGVRWARSGDRAAITTDVPHGVEAELIVAGRRLPLTAGTTTHELELAENPIPNPDEGVAA